ncbi:MAG TPA: efflux RND transporter permease subunit [Hyphomicrobiaceae bacterium]|nr:efflux RND transporter permease subunit [Hyphomicrobiaceae bacterium]
MSFTDIFIRRPVLASVVSLMILLIGLASGFSLPVRQFPELTNTKITITTAYPGANADLIRGFITTPMLQAVASAEGIDTLTSKSSQSTSTIELNLRLDANADRAVADVLSKVQQVKAQLPREAMDPVVVRQTGDPIALMYMSFNSKVMTSSQITDYLTRVVQPRLQTIEGVSQAQVFGAQTFAMRVWLNPDKMAALAVTPLDVRNALAANNFVTAAGQVKGDFVQSTINADTTVKDPAEFSKLVVATRGDALIRLDEIATVELGPEGVSMSTAFDSQKGVFVGLFANPAANPLTVIAKVRAAFPDIQQQLPPGLEGVIAYDATKFIESSIREVVTTLLEAAIIVVAVIFLFLGNLRSTLIPIVTIPLSLVGVMFALLALGYSINLLTLLALVLAIGLVVDDAIVVVENIHRHIEEGLSPFAAALAGAREIAVPVISMTITLAAVYAPIGFVSGLTGTLFREFAFTLAGAVVVSGIIALTLSPMMASKLLKPQQNVGWLARTLDRLFESLRRRYDRRLTRALDRRPMTLMRLAAVMAATGIMYVTTQKELAPEEDQGFLMSMLQVPATANLDYLEQATHQLAKVFDTVPEKDHLFTINGFPDAAKSFSGLILKPWGERERSQKQILGSLQGPVSGVANAQVFTFGPPSLPGSIGGPPVQFVITTTADYTQLAQVMDKMLDETRKSGLFIFAVGDLKFETPQVELKIDHDKANRLGITMSDLGGSLSTLLGGGYVNRFNMFGRAYQVIPQVPREYRLTTDWLQRYQVRTGSGTLVPLATVVSIDQSVQPNVLTTFQQLNSATIQGVPFPGRTVGEALDFLKAKAKEHMPAGFTYDFQGESRQYVQEGNTLVLTFVFALIVIYLVLAAQYESFRDPLIILIALPTAMFGALLPMNLGLASINIYTQVGLVTLIGLISKHGILMVDYANHLQENEGFSRRDAIHKAAGIRLRPILMTTAAMVVGMVPLLTAHGAGAASRFAIGLVIAAGMTVGTLFTLFVTPVVYTYIARDHAAARARAGAGGAVAAQGKAAE